MRQLSQQKRLTNHKSQPTWVLIAEDASVAIATALSHIAPHHVSAACQVRLGSRAVDVGQPANVACHTVPILGIVKRYAASVVSFPADDIGVVVVKAVRTHIAPVAHVLHSGPTIGVVVHPFHIDRIPWDRKIFDLFRPSQPTRSHQGDIQSIAATSNI